MREELGIENDGDIAAIAPEFYMNIEVSETQQPRIPKGKEV
ncbi:hypothetical protein ACFLST_01125 [Chloroflexota bacterium]